MVSRGGNELGKAHTGNRRGTGAKGGQGARLADRKQQSPGRAGGVEVRIPQFEPGGPSYTC